MPILVSTPLPIPSAGASQLVLPKQSISDYEQLKNYINQIGAFPGSFEVNSSSNLHTDTIQYYSPTRKVLTYPLNNWFSLD